jgi:hypothetical protein
VAPPAVGRLRMGFAEVRRFHRAPGPTARIARVAGAPQEQERFEDTDTQLLLERK